VHNSSNNSMRIVYSNIY